MNFIRDILDFLKSLLTWWFIVEPWEQAVRVRFGKRVRLFEAGAHVRIPFFDTVYVQNTRRRLLSIGSQTLTTADRKVLTIHSTIGYILTDVLKLQTGLHDADATIMQHVTSRLAQDIATHTMEQCAPADVAARVRAQMGLAQYGLDVVEFALTSYVGDIQTLRILSENAAPWFNYAALTTVLPDPKSAQPASSGR
jgi:hypothetical protein